ncbi:hypothetical protein MHYP_G00176420 [Metynnis hypsauchen]
MPRVSLISTLALPSSFHTAALVSERKRDGPVKTKQEIKRYGRRRGLDQGPDRLPPTSTRLMKRILFQLFIKNVRMYLPQSNGHRGRTKNPWCLPLGQKGILWAAVNVELQRARDRPTQDTAA